MVASALEVSQLESALSSDEHCGRVDVQMGDLTLMCMDKRSCDIITQVANKLLCKPYLLIQSQLVLQRPIPTKLHYHDQLAALHKTFLTLDNILMTHPPNNLHLQ